MSLLEIHSARNLQDLLQAPWVAYINLTAIKSPAEGIWKDFLEQQVHLLDKILDWLTWSKKVTFLLNFLRGISHTYNKFPPS